MLNGVESSLIALLAEQVVKYPMEDLDVVLSQSLDEQKSPDYNTIVSIYIGLIDRFKLANLQADDRLAFLRNEIGISAEAESDGNTKDAMQCLSWAISNYRN
jgi:hypothetical protein